MNTLANLWLAPASGESRARHEAASAQRYRELVGRCVTRWPLLLALLALLGLLLAFQRVVHEGVRQGDLRRIAVTTHANDLWRCNVISNQARRESCHALLNTTTTNTADNPGSARPSHPVPRTQR